MRGDERDCRAWERVWEAAAQARRRAVVSNGVHSWRERGSDGEESGGGVEG